MDWPRALWFPARFPCARYALGEWAAPSRRARQQTALARAAPGAVSKAAWAFRALERHRPLHFG